MDEVNSPPDRTVFKGDVWSFTAEPEGIPILNVTATASSSNPNSRWVFDQKASDAPHQAGTRSGSSWEKAAMTRSRDVIVR